MKRCLIITAVAVFLGVQPVQAQNFDVKPYVGAGIGVFGIEAKGTNGVVYNQKNTVFGGYGKVGVDIGDYLGAEIRVGATSSGTETQPAGTFGVPFAFDTQVKMSTFVSYLGKLQYPVTPDLHLHALLGATTAKFEESDFISTAGSTKTGFSYGFGADYYIQDVLSVGGEWMQYWTNVGSFTGISAEVKMWGAVATVAYHF